MPDAAPIGVLALQGDFAAHVAALGRVGAAAREVRTAEEILSAGGLVLPGGESTTLFKLMEGTGIPEAIAGLSKRGDPVLATCAGAIVVARDILAPDRAGLGLLDAAIVRNAYGRQLDSAVVTLHDVAPELGGGPLEAVFIRAPRFASLGPDVTVLARRDGDPVLVRQGNLVAATFHPELSADDRVLRLFLARRTPREEAGHAPAAERGADPQSRRMCAA